MGGRGKMSRSRMLFWTDASWRAFTGVDHDDFHRGPDRSDQPPWPVMRKTQSGRLWEGPPWQRYWY